MSRSFYQLTKAFGRRLPALFLQLLDPGIDLVQLFLEHLRLAPQKLYLLLWWDRWTKRWHPGSSKSSPRRVRGHLPPPSIGISPGSCHGWSPGRNPPWIKSVPHGRLLSLDYLLPVWVPMGVSRLHTIRGIGPALSPMGKAEIESWSSIGPTPPQSSPS